MTLTLRNFPLATMSTFAREHGACTQSVLSMLHLSKMMLTMAPEGSVDYTKLCSVLAWLVWEVATVEPNKQGCRPAGRCSCTRNQVCDGALQAHGATTQKV